MKCPKCKNVEMEPFEIEGAEFDYCAQKDGCWGLWCEKGEIAFYTESITDLPFVKDINESKKSSFDCPHCASEPLYTVIYDDDHGVEVDYCKACHGIFLDQGEIHKIEKSAIKIPFKDRMDYLRSELTKKGFTVFK